MTTERMSGWMASEEQNEGFQMNWLTCWLIHLSRRKNIVRSALFKIKFVETIFLVLKTVLTASVPLPSHRRDHPPRHFFPESLRERNDDHHSHRNAGVGCCSVEAVVIRCSLHAILCWWSCSLTPPHDSEFFNQNNHDVAASVLSVSTNFFSDNDFVDDVRVLKIHSCGDRMCFVKYTSSTDWEKRRSQMFLVRERDDSRELQNALLLVGVLVHFSEPLNARKSEVLGLRLFQNKWVNGRWWKQEGRRERQEKRGGGGDMAGSLMERRAGWLL